jgi:arabinogalactan oligomer/maltooligosaccharide transport system substrate-binding protein
VSWGDVPGWLSSVATIVALLFAAAAAIATRNVFRIESERDRLASEGRREQERINRRSQAALVSAWWDASSGPKGCGVFVRNASEAPVYQAHLTFLGRDDGSEDTKIHCLVIPPGELPQFLPVEPAPNDPGEEPKDFVRRVRLTFTDAAGVRWVRDEYGRLVELRPNLFIRTDSVSAKALEPFAEDFRATYGVSVSYETDSGPEHALTTNNQRPYQLPVLERSHGVVDAFIGAHDWIGELVERDLIEPTVLSTDHRAVFPPWTLDALTFDGKLYGLPTRLDTVALIRNTDLAPDPPATFDELVSTGTELCSDGRASEVLAIRISDLGDPFQIWPLFTSAGGSLFGRRPDGTWDPTDVQLATVEPITAFERLRRLGEDGLGVLRRSMDRNSAFRLFTSRRTAYLISSSDALFYAREANLPIEVTPVPPFAGGRPAEAFSLVLGLMMVKRGQNRIIAHDLFADYLTDARVMAAFAATALSPTALRVTEMRPLAVRQYRKLCDAAAPMPSFPQMRTVWRLLGSAEAGVIAGADPHTTATRLAEEVSTASQTSPNTTYPD